MALSSLLPSSQLHLRESGHRPTPSYRPPRPPHDDRARADETAPLTRLDGAARPGRRAEPPRTEKATSLLAAASHAGGACLGLLVRCRYILYTQQFRSLRFVIVLASPIESVQTLHSVSFLDEQGGQQS